MGTISFWYVCNDTRLILNQSEKLSNGTYSIKTHHGTYVGADASGKVYVVPHCKEWEQWRVEFLVGTKVAFKSHHNQYLGVDGHHHVYTIAHCKDWEKFDFVNVDK
jgi:hypothetical protein